MKETIDFHIIDKLFKENQISRLSYFNIFQPCFDDLSIELKRVIKVYFESYYVVTDLIDILNCIICHVFYEFKTTFEVDSKLLLENICCIYNCYVHDNRSSIISVDDIINQKCVHYKTTVALSKEQYSVFIKVFQEARSVYLALFLKRLLTIRVITECSNVALPVDDTVIMRDIDESVARLGLHGSEVMNTTGHNYTVITIKGSSCVTCANISDNNWNNVAIGQENGSILTADVQGGRGCTLVGHSMPVMDLAFTRDSQRLLSCSLDETVKLWNPEISHCLHTFRGHHFPVWSVASSPTMNNCFVSGGMDASVCVWDVHRDLPLRKLVGHLGSVKVTVFHKCGRYVASGSDDGHIRLWDVRSGSCVRLWESKCGSGGRGISALDFNDECSSVTFGGEGGLVETVSINGGDGGVVGSCNVGDPVTSVVCRHGGVVVLGTVDGGVYLVNEGGQVSRVVTGVGSGRLYGIRGTHELAGLVALIREQL